MTSSHSLLSSKATVNRDPALVTQGSDAGVFPWLLYLCTFPALFCLYNKFDAPAHPYEAQSASDIAQQAQTGDVLGRILIVALGLIGASLVVRYRKRIRLQPLIARILFAFLAWNALTAIWSVDPALSIRRLGSLAFMVIFCAGCATRMNTFSLSVFIASIPAVTILPGVFAEMRYGTFNLFSSGYRFGGTAPHPNVEAANLSVATILLAWLCWRTRGLGRICSVLATAFVAAFLILSGSRTCLVAVFAAIAFSSALILVRDNRRLIPAVAALLCLTAGSGALADLALSSGSARPGLIGLVQKNQDEGDPTSLNGRVDLWNHLLTYAAERPWRGYGFGSFWSPQRIEDVSAEQGWAIQQSHSAYIDELLGLGIPGALLYVALLFSSLAWCVVQFARGRDGYGAFAAMLLFIAIHDATESIDVSSVFTNTAFYMVVLYVALVRLEQPGRDRRLAKISIKTST